MRRCRFQGDAIGVPTSWPWVAPASASKRAAEQSIPSPAVEPRVTDRSAAALERIATALERPEREPVVVMFEGVLGNHSAQRVVEQVRKAWAQKYPPADEAATDREAPR